MFYSQDDALTYDDVLIVPGYSEVLPGDVDLKSRFSRNITVNVPIVSSAMDTVTESRTAIVMAQEGGLGVIHKNLDPETQAAHVRQVKRFESGMVVNPITISPDATLGFFLTDLNPADDKPNDLTYGISHLELYIKSVFESLMNSQDVMVNENKFEESRTVRIDDLGIAATDFGITQAQAQQLYDSGMKATQDFLSKIN